MGFLGCANFDFASLFAQKQNLEDTEKGKR
jgi:hypothetical protein